MSTLPPADGIPSSTTPTGWAERIVHAWERHGTVLLALVVFHALVTTTMRLYGVAFDASIAIIPDGSGGAYGPIDFMNRYAEVRQWFSGLPTYGVLENADYPPASYAILWPLLGGSLPTVRVLWVLTVVLSLVTIGALAAQQSGARTVPARAFMALFILVSSSTQLTVWLGQLGLHVVVLLLGAATLVCARSNLPSQNVASWRRDLLIAALLVAALVKPTVAAPVVLAVVLIAGRWRLALLIGLFYIALTAFAAAFQEPPLHTVLSQWLGQVQQEGNIKYREGSANLNLWLWWMGLGAWKLHASLITLVATALWLWRYRHADPWVLIGVAALVARLWIHHRAHDDVLFVLAAIPLFRLVGSPLTGGAKSRVVAGLALALLYVAGHARMSMLLEGAAPGVWWPGEVVRTLAILTATVVLIWQVQRSSGTAQPKPAHLVPPRSALLPRSQPR